MKNAALVFSGRFEMSRQQAAIQQIDMAIELFHRRQWPCSITLALAVETQLQSSAKPFVMSKLQSEFGAEFVDTLNEPRNRLKHTKDRDTVTIFEMDALMAVLRAISKFTASYGAWSEDMAKFDASFKERLAEVPDV